MAGLSLTVVGHLKSRQSCVKSHTEFTISVCMEGTTTALNRRYSEFAALDAQLRPGMGPLPMLPPKGFVKKLSPSFIDARARDLGNLLSAMVLCDPTLRSPGLQDFLGVTLLTEIRRDPIHATSALAAESGATPPTLLESMHATSAQVAGSGATPPTLLESMHATSIQVAESGATPLTLLESMRPKGLPDFPKEKIAYVSRPSWLIDLADETSAKSPLSTNADSVLYADEFPNLANFCSANNHVEQQCASCKVQSTIQETLRPDLSGRWVQVRFEGDMEQLLVDAGLSWAIRRMAKGMNYGVGKTFVTISQSDDAIELIMEMPTKSPTTMAFVVGKLGWQEITGADAKPLLVKPAWEGSALVMERKTLSGKEVATVRRWVDPKSGELVEEVATSKGGKVLRLFKKQ